MKKCLKCKKVKPDDDYYNNPKAKNGKCEKCKDCSRLYAKKRRDRLSKIPYWMMKENIRIRNHRERKNLRP